MFYAEAFFQLNIFVLGLAKLSDEEVLNEMLRKIKAGEMGWWCTLQPLLVLAGRRWKRCAQEVRAYLAITVEDERLLDALPSNNRMSSTVAAYDAYNGILSNDPNVLRRLLLCISITRRLLSVAS